MPEKIERCVCGKEAECIKSAMVTKWRVVCSDPRCWTGPWRGSERSSVNIWNRVMRAAKGGKRG